jgi:hypothetical protein
MRLLTALAILALPSAAFADELTLRNGSTFTGAVREQGDKVTIETEFGSMTFKKIDVQSVRSSRDPVSVLEEKLRAASSVKDLMALADWAREKDLRAHANRLYEQVVLREPDHAGARNALGYEFIDGRWLRGDELLVAYGLVKVDGRWMEKAEADRIAAQRREQEPANPAQEQIPIEVPVTEPPAADLQELPRVEADERQWSSPGWTYRLPDDYCPPATTVVQVPRPAPQPATRITTQESRDRNAMLPPRPQDRSPVPLTPPMVVPLTPPAVIPIPRATTSPPAGEEKKK